MTYIILYLLNWDACFTLFLFWKHCCTTLLCFHSLPSPWTDNSECTVTNCNYRLWAKKLGNPRRGPFWNRKPEEQVGWCVISPLLWRRCEHLSSICCAIVWMAWVRRGQEKLIINDWSQNWGNTCWFT